MCIRDSSLGAGLAQIPEIAIDLSTVQTNIVVFDVSALGVLSLIHISEPTRPY